MNWKKFFEPTLGKLIILFTLFSIFNYISSQEIVAMIPPETAKVYGFPLKFITIGGPELGTNISWVGFLINVIFWYLVSCPIIWVYSKMKKK